MDESETPPTAAPPKSTQRKIARELIRAGSLCGVIAFGGMEFLPAIGSHSLLFTVWILTPFLGFSLMMAGFVLWYCE